MHSTPKEDQPMITGKRTPDILRLSSLLLQGRYAQKQTRILTTKTPKVTTKTPIFTPPFPFFSNPHPHSKRKTALPDD